MNTNSSISCKLTTNVDLSLFSGSVNLRVGFSGTVVSCPITGTGTSLVCDNIPVGAVSGTFTTQYNASGSGNSYVSGSNVSVASVSVTPNNGPTSGGTNISLTGSGFIDGIKVLQMDSGYLHTCALLATGNIRCWGNNGNGQLGYGDFMRRDSPGGDIDLGGIKVTQVSAGAFHTCALLVTASVRCWGFNAGQGGGLGYGDALTRNSPGAM